MNRILLILFMILVFVQTILQSAQLYVHYNFWQMDKRFVDSTYQDLDKKTDTQYYKGDSHAL